MRISANTDDPGYGQFNVCLANNKWPRIYINGVEQQNVITLDTDLGLITRAATDASGVPTWDDYSIRTETLYGEIEVVWS